MVAPLPQNPLSDALAPYTNPPPLQPYELFGIFSSNTDHSTLHENLQSPESEPGSQSEDHSDPAEPELAQSSLKRKRGRLKVASSSKRPRLEESPQDPGPSSSARKTATHRFTTSSTPIPASAMSQKVPSPDRQFHDFQWRMLTLCGEFYDAASKLVEDAPAEVISRCYKMHDPHSVNPLALLNEAKRTCDFLLQQSSNLSGRPSSPGQSPPVAQSPFSFLGNASTSPRPSLTSRITSTFTRPGAGNLSLFDSFRPASTTPSVSAKRPPTAVPIEPSATPKRSIRSPTLFPQSQSQITQNQGPWTDQENERLRKLSEHFKLPNGETDWQKVAAEFGPTRSKHQVLIKATSLGLKPSSTRPSRRPRDPAATSSGTAGAEHLRSPSRSASTPGVPASGPPLAPLQTRTPRTPITPIDVPLSTAYPAHSVVSPQASHPSAAGGMAGMMWTAPSTGNGGYYRQRTSPQTPHTQVPHNQMLYSETVQDDPSLFLWMQPQQTQHPQSSHQHQRSPSQEGHGAPRGYGY